MTQYLFMNEKIREKKPSGPVIVAQDDFSGAVRQRNADEFEFWHGGEKIGRVVFKREGLPECETHEVRAWVELDDTVIVVDPRDRKPASAKTPNRKVTIHSSDSE